MRVEFHPEAKREAREAAAYIEERRPEYGAKFREEIRTALLLMRREPRIWPIRLYGFRRCVTQLFKYQIWYLDREDSVYVIAMHHSSRNQVIGKKEFNR